MPISQMINSPETESPYWIEMVQYLVLLALPNTSIDGVNRALLNKESKIGRNYQDYKRTLDILISQQVILIDDGRLALGLISGVPWVEKGLETGTEEIWELAEKIEPNLKWARKYDNTQLLKTGLDGEKAVLNLLYQQVDERYHSRIRHIALVDDYAGFDIVAPSIKDHENSVYLEVKSTVRPAEDFTFYISRNEFDVGSKTRNWAIVCVKIKNNKPEVLGHLKLDEISALLPIETSDQVKWQSLKVTIPKSLIHEGLY